MGRERSTSDSWAKDVSEMRRNLRDTREQMRVDMERGRRDVNEMRDRVGDHKAEVMGQMKEIKQIMTSLFQLQ